MWFTTRKLCTGSMCVCSKSSPTSSHPTPCPQNTYISVFLKAQTKLTSFSVDVLLVCYLIAMLFTIQDISLVLRSQISLSGKHKNVRTDCFLTAVATFPNALEDQLCSRQTEVNYPIETSSHDLFLILALPSALKHSCPFQRIYYCYSYISWIFVSAAWAAFV